MKKIKIYKLYSCVFILFLILTAATQSFSQNCISLGGANPTSYSTDFNALGNSPSPQNGDASNIFDLSAVSPAVTRRILGKFDNATNDTGGTVSFSGWAVVEEGTASSSVSGRYNVGDGTAAGGNTYSFANAANPSDRALGSLTNDVISVNYLGTCFVNASSSPISTVYIGYTGELWRRGDAVGDRLAFQYAVKPSGTTPSQNIFEGAFTNFSALDFSAANTNGTGAGQRDGNAAVNRSIFPVTAVNLATPLAAGQSLYVRWVDTNVPNANDDGLAIDDFRIYFVAPTSAGVTVSGRVLSAQNRGIPNAGLTLVASNGGTRLIKTNPFGYYRFTEVPIGSYVINVKSKRFSFNNSTQVLTLTEDLENVNFTASAK